MKIETNNVDYGIYIDGRKAFVIALNHVVHEAFMDEAVVKNEHLEIDGNDGNQQEHEQNRENEELKKFCKSIIEKIENAHNILVFGPSTAKFELQKELVHAKRLKTVAHVLETTDVMDKDAALRFAKDHYSVITAGQQLFTGKKMN